MTAGEMASPDRGDRDVRHGTDVLLVVSTVVVLVVSALAVQGDQISGPERTIFRSINDLPEVLYWPSALVMQLGNVFAVVVAAVAALCFRRFRLAFGLAAAGVGAYLSAKLIKNAVKRDRPGALLTHVHQRGGVVGGLGYVSGHAAVAFAVVTVATMWFGPKFRLLLWGLAVAVAFGRVYVGAHLPLDVLGGAALGIGCGALVRLAIGARRHGRHDSARGD